MLVAHIQILLRPELVPGAQKQLSEIIAAADVLLAVLPLSAIYEKAKSFFVILFGFGKVGLLEINYTQQVL